MLGALAWTPKHTFFFEFDIAWTFYEVFCLLTSQPCPWQFSQVYERKMGVKFIWGEVKELNGEAWGALVVLGPRYTPQISIGAAEIDRNGK